MFRPDFLLIPLNRHETPQLLEGEKVAGAAALVLLYVFGPASGDSKC